MIGFGFAIPKLATRVNGTFITLSGSSVADTATVGTAVGTASLSSSYTGTPAWTLTNSAGGKYAINGSTGAVTVASALTGGVDTIAINVTGTTPLPSPDPQNFLVVVTSAGFNPSLDFSDSRNSQYTSLLV